MTAAIKSAPPTVDEVVGRIQDSVWTLVRADQMKAALVLLESQREDFLRAWRLEILGVAETAPARPSAEPVTCVSADHVRADCHAAVSLGELSSDAVCRWCSEHPPVALTDTGSIVHVITPVGSASVRRSTRKSQQLAKTG